MGIRVCVGCGKEGPSGLRNEMDTFQRFSEFQSPSRVPESPSPGAIEQAVAAGTIAAPSNAVQGTELSTRRGTFGSDSAKKKKARDEAEQHPTPCNT